MKFFILPKEPKEIYVARETWGEHATEFPPEIVNWISRVQREFDDVQQYLHYKRMEQEGKYK